MKDYNFHIIQEKIKKKWEEARIYKVKNDALTLKNYVFEVSSTVGSISGYDFSLFGFTLASSDLGLTVWRIFAENEYSSLDGSDVPQDVFFNC